ncbi:MAG: hypothetical protein IJU76_09050 [Desulfovibrionaceae bacterium]|nr:hypothetical protein [Desulfovibrionaceae bacterium]
MAGFRKSFLCMTFLVMSVFLLTSLANAGPAYRRLVTNAPNEQSWRDGLTVTFETDVAACKRAYGESRWFPECQAPAPGREGQIVSGIVMTPQVAGTWRWINETAMHFTPKTHLAPNTVYTISTERMTLPMRYALSRNCIYRTPPQAVHIDHETLWIDPSEKGKHVLTVPLRFIWPINREFLEKNVHIVKQTQSSLSLGPTRFVWNEGQDEVLVTIPVLSLPEKNTALQLSVTGLPSWHEENGKRIFQAKSQRQKIQTNIVVTGTDRVMDVQSITLTSRYDDGLDRSYELLVKTTLATKPADVLDKLDLLLLPKKAKDGASKDCDWENMPAISADDIARSEKVTATLLQPGGEAATEIRLRLMIPEGRGLVCAMKEGLRSVAGYTLNRVRRFVRTAPAISPEINFLQPGNILPLTKGQKLDIHTVGIDTLAYDVAMVREPFFALMASKTGFDLNDDVDANEFSNVFRGHIAIAEKGLGKASYTALDLAKITGNDGAALMLVTLTGSREGKVVRTEKRLILLSDLGLLLKTERSGSHVVFVQSLSGGEGLKNVEVRLLGANGLPLVTATTDSEGLCRLPSTQGFTREKKPSVLMARKGNDFAWLPLGENEDIVDLSDFAISGRHVSDQGFMASVFSERGIYMPGEKLHFGTLVRNQDWTELGANLPIEGRLYDPKDKLLVKERLSVGRDGLATFSAESGEATGRYRFDVCLVHGSDHTVIGSATARVEEFEPDTLALDVRYTSGEPKGWMLTQKKNQVTVHLDNLYGEPARGHRVRARFIQEPAALSLPSVGGFTVVDTSIGEAREVDLPEALTDDQGNCTLTLPAETVGMGSYTGRLEVEGFALTGGRAVRKSIACAFSPKSLVLAYKPEGEANNLAYIPEGSRASLRLLVLDAELKPGDAPVTLSLSERRFVTSLVSDSSGRYRYDATPVDTEISAQKVRPEADGILWDLPTRKAGEYLLSVLSTDGTAIGQIAFTIAGNSLAKPGEEPVLSNGTLRLTLDKESYEAGETISFQIAAPFEGRGIATLERDKVHAHAFFTAKPGSSVHKLTIPSDFEGRGYLNVSFVRALTSNAVYMDPHAYAVAPVTVGVKQRDMGIRLTAPESVLPGTDVTITLSAAHEGRVQLFLVDEGVLQLTRYRVPDPLRDLLTDRALDVVTREAYHRVMPDHERLLGRIPGFGGDMGSAGGRFQNPFRRKNEPPFVYWSSLLPVGPKPVTVTVPVPPYCAGAFRVMAVGSSAADSSRLMAGSAFTRARVRGSVIVKPQLPLVVAPRDVFQGALVIANTVAGSGPNASLTYKVTLPEGLALKAGTLQGTLRVPENAERAIPLTFLARDVLGEARIDCEASLDGSHSGKRSQSLSIRPGSPMRATEKALALTPAEENTITSDRTLYPYGASTKLTIAEGPLLALRAVIDRLDAYPYGCTEQMISKAFPSVVLWDAPKIRKLVSVSDMKAGEAAIAAALARIRSAAQYDGVALWLGNGESNPFVTAYAGDFLVAMAEHGLNPPEDLRDTILSNLEDMVARTPESINDGRIKIYAAWVLLRDGRIMTSQLENLETWFRSNVNAWERDVLASLLAESYATLRLRKKAAERLPAAVGATDDLFFSTSVARSLHALIVKNMGGKDISIAQILDAAFSENATTLDLAMACRALTALIGKDTQSIPNLTVRCEDTGAQAERTTDALLTLDAPACTRFTVLGVHENGLHALLSEDGFDREPLPPSSSRIDITRQILDGNTPVTKIGLGTVVTSRVCARSIGNSLDTVVLVDLLPGGLEPLLEDPASTEGLVRYERREDRGIFFVNLTPEERCFSHKLRAATRGSFIVPQAHGAAMYDPTTNGVSAAGKIGIE